MCTEALCSGRMMSKVEEDLSKGRPELLLDAWTPGAEPLDYPHQSLPARIWLLLCTCLCLQALGKVSLGPAFQPVLSAPVPHPCSQLPLLSCPASQASPTYSFMTHSHTCQGPHWLLGTQECPQHISALQDPGLGSAMCLVSLPPKPSSLS